MTDRGGLPDPFDGSAGSNPAVASRAAVGRPGGIPGGWAGGGPVGLPPANATNAAAYARLVFPPWVFKIPESQDFRLVDYRVPLAAAVGATAAPATLRLQVPRGQVGWLQSFRLYILLSTATSDVGYTVRINGAAVPGLTDQRNPPGSTALVILTSSELQIRIPEGAVVDVLFTNFVAQAEVVGAMIAGWFHPLPAELRQWGPVGR